MTLDSGQYDDLDSPAHSILFDDQDPQHTAAVEEAKAEDIVSPGHIFPLMAQAGGTLARAGHTEAACRPGAHKCCCAVAPSSRAKEI